MTYVFCIKGVWTKKVDAKNKSTAQNTKSDKFSAPKIHKKIQNSFLKRAQIPHFDNTGFPIR